MFEYVNSKHTHVCLKTFGIPIETRTRFCITYFPPGPQGCVPDRGPCTPGAGAMGLVAVAAIWGSRCVGRCRHCAHHSGCSCRCWAGRPAPSGDQDRLQCRTDPAPAPARCHCQGMEEHSRLGLCTLVSPCRLLHASTNGRPGTPLTLSTHALQHRCSCVMPQLSYLHITQHSCLLTHSSRGGSSHAPHMPALPEPGGWLHPLHQA